MLKLKELHLENFRSYKKLDLVDLDKKGLTLIQGTNGKGKSSFRSAIEYLLLDRTSDNLPLDELPYNSGKNCVLNCVLQRDNDIIEIIKYRNHNKFVNQTVLKVNGDDSLTTTDRRETQRNIESLLGITENSLFTSTIFTANSPSFPTAKETDRKDILYSALDLDKYIKYFKLAKEKCEEIEDEIKSFKTNKEYMNTSLNNIQVKIEEMKTKIEEYEETRKSKIKNIIDSKEELKEEDTTEIEKEVDITEIELGKFDDLDILSKDITDKTLAIAAIESNIEKRNELNKRAKEINLKIENLEKEYKETSDIKEDLHKLEKEFGTITIPNNNLEEEIAELTEITIKFESELDNLNKEKNNVGNGKCPIFNDECDRLVKQKEEVLEIVEPKIAKLTKKLEKAKIKLEIKRKEKSDIDKEKKRQDKLEKEITELNNQIKRCVADNENIDKRLEEYRDEINELGSKFDSMPELEDDLNKAREELVKLTETKGQYVKINNKLDELNENKRQIENNNKLVNEKIKECNRQIKELSNESNPYTSILESHEKEYEDKKKEIKTVNNTISNLVDDLKYYEFWKVGFSKAGIPNLKSEGFLYALETEINNTLSIISDRMYVELGAQDKLKSKKVREKISYKVFHPDKQITDYNSYSSGEKQRVKIADLFAFHSLIGTIDMMIFDEVLELSLDNEGIDEIMDILKVKANELGSLFVISHNERIKDKFDNVWTVEKKNGVSSIKEN